MLRKSWIGKDEMKQARWKYILQVLQSFLLQDFPDFSEGESDDRNRVMYSVGVVFKWTVKTKYLKVCL